MKIVVIHGSPRKGNTYKAVEIFKNSLLKHGEAEFTDFFLPKDAPNFCIGCYKCFFKGEDLCPHAEYIQPIVKEILKADGIIMSSPVYVLAESGAVKAFLDHLAYIFIVHRPRKEMFSKKAMVISTTAGAGTGAAIKTITKNLKFWGINRIYSYGISLQALSWEEMKEKRRLKFEKKLQKKADLFYKDLIKGKKHSPYIIQKIIFIFIRKMLRNSKEDTFDKKYWNENGWLNGSRTPFS